MMQHFDGSIETERRSEAASCIFHIKRDTTAGRSLRFSKRLSRLYSETRGRQIRR
jgi:hypothetical protein